MMATGLRSLDGRGRVYDPRGLALAYMHHNGLAGARDADDVLSDAMLGIAKALETWSDGDDDMPPLVVWCHWKMRQEINTGRRRRSRWRRREALVDWADVDQPHPGRSAHPSPGPDLFRIDLIDDGYKRVEDRVTLQRWADMAHLSDLQADLLAWLAVHEGTVIRHTHLHGEPSPLTGKTTVMRSGLARLRRVAITGRPFVRVQPAPTYSIEDVRAAVDG